ncbi:MAG TPA: hypothetical protein VI408_06850 [Gaiellaceae bacterium]
MTPDDAARADYAGTTDLIRVLTDVRFRLLALVPTIAGAGVGLLSRGGSSAERIAVGAIGLSATLGVAVYELRNTQIYDYALHRAKELERRLGMPSVFGSGAPGGLYAERPGRELRLLGAFVVGHDRGLALVYAAAVGGWTYVFSWGALHALSIGSPQRAGGAIGVVAALVVLVELLRVDVRSNKAGAPASASGAARAAG